MNALGSARLRAGLSFAEWEDEGRMFRCRQEASSWDLGDWLVRGEVLGMDPGFKRSMAILGYSRSHVYTLHYTAKGWPAADRVSAVSWIVHRHLLAEKDAVARRELLQVALRERWSDRDAMAHFRRGADRPSKAKRSYENRRVVCPCCGHVFPIKGNKEGARAEASKDEAVHAAVGAGGE